MNDRSIYDAPETGVDPQVNFLEYVPESIGLEAIAVQLRDSGRVSEVPGEVSYIWLTAPVVGSGISRQHRKVTAFC